jgi:D-tyrosyl-tRNA(Tyr) deacylase
MRVVIQRVKQAQVVVEGEVVGSIGFGLCLLLGIHHQDTLVDLEWTVTKIGQLRIFEDAEGKMNLSLSDVGGAALVVSQFTLYADCYRGRRPSFVEAARPEQAIPMYEAFCKRLAMEGIPVAQGVFGAKMEVALVNAGPVTVVLDSPKRGESTL